MVKFVGKITDTIIFTNIFLAAAVTSLVFETYIILFGCITDYKYPFFLFCSTLFLYCFHRVFRFNNRGREEKFADRHQWIKENKSIFYCVMTLAAIGIVWSLLCFVNSKTILCLLPIGFISIGYTVPIIPIKGEWKRLRDISGIKIFLISLVLGLTTVLLPILSVNNVVIMNKPAIFFVFFRRISFIFAITIPFDIRDMEYDKEKGTKTIPIMIGIKKSKTIAVFSLVVFVLLALVQFKVNETSLYYLSALIISAFITILVLRRTDISRSDFFYSFYVEGMMLLQCALILAAYKFS